MANQVRDYSKLAVDIIREVGGKSNISNAARCATRLRLVLKETPKGAKEKVSNMPGVINVVESGGQFQVVIGMHVGDVFDRVAQELNLDISSESAEQPKQSIINRIIGTMSAVFAPFIYILAAAGILQGILILINLAVPSFSATGTYEVLSFMSWSPFTFLPILIAITASKHFKCNMYIAVLCCMALVNPSWGEMAARIAGGESISFLAFPLSETTYTSTVLPPLFLVWGLSYLERFVKKIIPDVVKALFVPLVCFVIAVPVTILVIGPVTTIAANGIADGFNFLIATVPALTAAIIGGLWQILVIFGVHWGVTPMVLANFDLYGHDSFQAFQTISVCAQMAAAFGVYIKSRNKEFKGVALSAGVTGIFGITEPAIYGVTLRLKKPFICGCIMGAIGAVVTSFFNSVYYAYAGLPGLLTIVNAIGENNMSFIGEAIGVAIGVIGTIILVQIVGFDDPKAENEEDIDKIDNIVNIDKSDSDKKAVSDKKEIIIECPMSGKVIPVSEVEDPAFSSGAMGVGVGIEPTEYNVYAPADCTIESVFDTKHAIGLTSDDGVEMLIHVGMDTVRLEGKYFDIHCKTGDKVKKGELLLSFDGTAIANEGYSLVTPFLVLNPDVFLNIYCEEHKEVNHNERVMEIKI